MRTVGRHAVVIGASMAGLLTARVLTEAYDRVTVVERDVLPTCGVTTGVYKIGYGPISVIGDLRLPEVEGRRTLKVRLVNAYLPHVHAAATVDGRVGAAFLRVSNLLDPPPSLLSPTLVLRVLRANLRRRRDAPVELDRPAVASHVG